MQTALQPVSQGGEWHFTGGNICIIYFAHLLLDDENLWMEFAGNDQLDGPSWTKLLEAEFGIESEELEDGWKEALFTGKSINLQVTELSHECRNLIRLYWILSHLQFVL